MTVSVDSDKMRISQFKTETFWLTVKLTWKQGRLSDEAFEILRVYGLKEVFPH